MHTKSKNSSGKSIQVINYRSKIAYDTLLHLKAPPGIVYFVKDFQEISEKAQNLNFSAKVLYILIKIAEFDNPNYINRKAILQNNSLTS